MKRILNSVRHPMPKATEKFRNFFNECSDLPRLDDAPTLELVNFVKAHQDQDDGAGIVDDSDDPLDPSVDLPELTRPLELRIWFVS